MMLPTNPTLALDLSTCSVIATGVAEHLAQRGVTYDVEKIIDRVFFPDDPAVLLDAEQVSALLAVKRSTVFELSRRRLDPLPSVSIGRAKRFDRSAVNTWIQGQRSRS